MNDELPVEEFVGDFLSALTDNSSFLRSEIAFLRSEIDRPNIPAGTMGMQFSQTRYYVRLKDFISWSDANSFGPPLAGGLVVGVDLTLAAALTLLASLTDKLHRMTSEERDVLTSVAKALGSGKYRNCLPITELPDSANSIEATVGSLLNKGILEYCSDGQSVRMVL